MSIHDINETSTRQYVGPEPNARLAADEFMKFVP
jgi:hypothetical protein